MQAKTGRFNYLPIREGSPEGKLDSDRQEYKHIISQLTRQHESKEVKDLLATDQPPKRKSSPVGNVQLRNDPSNRQIKSIILNQQITPSRHQELIPKKKEAYRIIKDAHIISDKDLDTFCEQNNSPPKVYYSPFKEHRVTPERQELTPIKFYQIKNQPIPKIMRKDIMARNNQPYVNQAVHVYEAPQKDPLPPNPEVTKEPPPKKVEVNESRTTKTNKAYKPGKSQERIYQQNAHQHIDYPPKNPVWKRSCYDYVPEEMKARLKGRQY